MELTTFTPWEVAKIVALVFLGLVSSKSIAGLRVQSRWVKPAFYALVLAASGLGAWFAGNDVAAEVYGWSSSSKLSHGDLDRAYTNAQQAVRMRPGNLGYWRSLLEAKIRLGQVQSAVDDEPAIKALSGGDLDERDAYQFAVCSYFLGQYDNVVAVTLRLIRQNPFYAPPYVLQGMAYTAEHRYSEAQQSFAAVHKAFPNNQIAVEGLAKAFYLAGDRQRALDVLNETAESPFPDAARKRFDALKGLYDQ